MEIIRGNVGYFKERGGTIGWLIEDEGIMVIDTQFPEQAGHFIEELRKESQSGIEYLINTHHHGDHTSGNIAFKDLAKHILAHENSVKNQKTSAEANGTQANQLYPNMTYTSQWSKQVGKEFITLDYWGRAHTDGDSIIHFTNANVVHMGDLVFNRRHPYIDKGAGASIANWISILDKTRAHFDDKAIFIFGHAEDGYEILGNKDDIRAFTNYLEKVLEHVGMLLKQGKSEEEILKETMIPGAEEWKGEGIQRSLKAAITELKE
jgi:glyoxylase-like metal-dependent hydrolase (beta-lactamase superfamily II)